MSNSVFTTSDYSKRYYLTHPWKFIKTIFFNLRAAWMRATKGYCYKDIWNWDYWFLNTAPPMLKYLAEHSHTYPGTERFPTPESWQEWLSEMADKLVSCREEEQEKRNQYHSAYIKSLSNDWSKPKGNILDRNRISKLYYIREKEIAEEAHETLKDVFSQLAEYFYVLWD